MASFCVQSPALAQADTSTSAQNHEIILNDAESVARLNPPKPPNPSLETTPAVATTDNTPTVQAAEMPARFPRDISAEFIDVIAGVPIMKDPESCGKGLLEIGVTVENVAKEKGLIVADLHDDVKENFLVWDKVVLRVRATPKKGQTKFCIPLTKPGDYAIAIYHDKNGNTKFDKNFLGIPSEHFGMSNNPKFGLKSPKFEEAVFTVPENGTDITINLLKASNILGGQKK